MPLNFERGGVPTITNWRVTHRLFHGGRVNPAMKGESAMCENDNEEHRTLNSRGARFYCQNLDCGATGVFADVTIRELTRAGQRCPVCGSKVHWHAERANQKQ
jgi:hypothetical protein